MSKHKVRRREVDQLKLAVSTLEDVVADLMYLMESTVDSVRQLNEIASMHNDVMKVHTLQLRELPTTASDSAVAEMVRRGIVPASYSGDHAQEGDA